MNVERKCVEAVLVFPIRNGEVLLARKLKKIGKGCRNGYGGMIEEGESPEEAMCRELREESSVIACPEGLQKVAHIEFTTQNDDGSEFICLVHIFFLTTWTGTFMDTEEMDDPQWFPTNALLLNELMAADRVWLPRVLAGEKLVGTALYGPHQKELIGEVQLRTTTAFER